MPWSLLYVYVTLDVVCPLVHSWSFLGLWRVLVPLNYRPKRNLPRSQIQVFLPLFTVWYKFCTKMIVTLGLETLLLECSFYILVKGQNFLWYIMPFFDIGRSLAAKCILYNDNINLNGRPDWKRGMTAHSN